MKLSKKHGIIVVAFLAVIACGWGVFRAYMATTRNTQGQQPLPASQSQAQQNISQSEIDSVKDLVDGEYTFPPMDTSTWQTYRNEELGFEVRIPKDWEMREMYKEEGKSIDIWFSQKGKWYETEGGSYNAIIISISFKTNPFFQPPESVLKSFKESHENVSIQRTVINGVPFYYNNGFDEGIMTTASFLKNYSFSLSSSLILDAYPDVRHVLRGMIQTVKFDGISSTQQNTSQSEVDSVKDLVDGEYTFPPMDTSTWQTYRNEELGFEVKIPKNWELANSYEEDDIGGKYLNFGEKGASYDMPEGGKIDSAVLIRASARDSVRAMPLREYVQRRKTSYDERLYQFSLNGTNAVMLGGDEVDFFEGNKSWSISFQLYHDGNKDTYNAEYQVFLGIVQTFKFFR